MFACVRISMCERISASMSKSSWRLWNSPRPARRSLRQMFISLLCRLHHPPDGQAHVLPPEVLDLDLLAYGLREPVVLGLPTILGLAPFRFDPPLVLQAIERRIERALPTLSMSSDSCWIRWQIPKP